MKKIILISLIPFIILSSGCRSNSKKSTVPADLSDELLIIDAPQLWKLNFDISTGGLPVVPGLETYTVIRSDREHPENAEGYGYTYQHHPDLAVWKGRLYVGWNSCEVDEDTWPSRELISSSADGKTWTKPAEMFPQGVSAPIRMYFFLSPNGHMLIAAGLRLNHDKLSERTKSALVVRELKPDHSHRWPLAMLTSDDGITFRNPYAIHDELPPRRYEGLHKDLGASYHRGLSKWNNDGSRKDDAIWMVYSLNKEDIRVVRITVPE